ncbi:transposase [Candidatus Roizmanbacteria bacterium CG22_combo_CG10-13_8_21_14_all_38_20]|uniref:Transposase n=1 Tax=Candidatus Roizmanbacteria bacterium CG22_combo_CG10-13_8_21_14_all_38_20 TaxID=1974862 RepID=A0A2H0BU38_9BACT|nr:type II toxin-antitoxin system VapC family toxin [Candidatus Microgenomates bacterium]PIP61141.1 MAG: transposase [Candidatus Roizmanbacteria bacterium CG22_combo_CG10-13_8_21_14_all_38_20]PJC31131.1 MAG: transposase [Candidatus Roizmanbacteria bacterium CG_4_9_14_0_2_um_filter_38_17]
MVFIDTHVLLWLFDKKPNFLSKRSIGLLENNSIIYSPIVELELQYLFEVKKIKSRPFTLIAELEETINLQLSTSAFNSVIQHSIKNSWTRDPFDRIITADAQLNRSYLITADKLIQKHYRKALI